MTRSSREFVVFARTVFGTFCCAAACAANIGCGAGLRAVETANPPPQASSSRSPASDAASGDETNEARAKPGPVALLNAPAPDLRDLMAWRPDDPWGSAPSWESLSLESLDSEVVVLAFLSNSCPVTMAYEKRLIEFASRYSGRGVRMIAIAVNPFECDKPEALAQRMRERGYNFWYGRQESQTAVRDYQVETTPTFFVLDRDRMVRYVGAFDDDFKAAKASRSHLEDAVEALLAGQPAAVPYVKSRGSAIALRSGVRPNDPHSRESEGVR